ncbi:MAG TPA: TIGR03086 family metal-binding protein [Acidimicrobiales bacterium]|nr:TIGR03086 family metal-binding protein [Acidimicrobiales bacterium]
MGTASLEQAFASTHAVLANITPEDMDRPTPCASWHVRELVDHIVSSATFFAVAAEGGDPSADQAPEGEPLAAYDAGAARALSAFSADGVMEKVIHLPFGDLPGSAFLWIATGDTFTHGWDLAKATGQSTDLDPALAGELLTQLRPMLPDGMRGPDGQAPFGPEVTVDESAPAADRLAGFLGRQP